MNIIILSLLNALLLVSGQVFWKYGMVGQEFNTAEKIIKVLFSPLILVGIFVYVVATVLWLYILSKADISYVYPLTSIVHIIMFFCAIFIFKEHIQLTRWVGVFLITVGVCFVGIK
jgi:drug/metabolite transporter (DMT)-like permease